MWMLLANKRRDIQRWTRPRACRENMPGGGEAGAPGIRKAERGRKVGRERVSH